MQTEAKAPEVPRLSSSIANIIVTKSPLHAYDKHRLLGGNKSASTDAMEEGKLLEKFILNHDLDKLCIVEADNWKSKAAKEAWELAELKGLQAVLQREADEAKTASDRILKSFLEMGHDLRSTTGQAQVRMEWTVDGVNCSGVIDYLDAAKGIIYDFKTTSDASDKKIQRSIFDFGYDIQANAYEEAVGIKYPERLGRIKTFFLFAETKAPFAINPVQLAGSMSELGRRKWSRAKETWKECLASGVWPGYAMPNKRIEATAWQLSAEMEANLTGGDFEVVGELGGMQ